MSIKFSRRSLILGAASLSALGLLGRRKFLDKWGPRLFKGQVGGANFKRGHRLFQKDFPAFSRTIKTKVSIVGGGVSGLASAYHLAKAGEKDVLLFELEDHLGGKSHCMDRQAPWGAHYLPLPNLENRPLLDFLADIKAIQGFNSAGVPIYDELMVCSDPMEKLLIYGRFQEGLIPKDNISETESQKIEAFMQKMQGLSQAKGSDQKYAFEIPLEHSSQDPKFLKLDHITMLDYLKQHGLDCDALNWYVDYCCRDDFGVGIENISAWAGVHYFAARRGRGENIHDQSVLTWPQGNHFLIEQLIEKSQVKHHTAHLLFEVGENELLFYDFQKNETVKVISEQIILAMPQFILGKILNQKTSFEYSPWLVANLKIRWDKELDHALAWDNVNYHGKGIGFVVANHQRLNTSLQENYLTYYWPLTHLPPKEARQFALKRTHQQWSEDIMQDLVAQIPDIEERILEVNFWPWGHGMVMPYRGFMTKQRKELVTLPSRNIHLAHTDLSGVSLFEEGFYRGEVAAKKVLQRLSRT